MVGILCDILMYCLIFSVNLLIVFRSTSNMQLWGFYLKQVSLLCILALLHFKSWIRNLFATGLFFSNLLLMGFASWRELESWEVLVSRGYSLHSISKNAIYIIDVFHSNNTAPQFICAMRARNVVRKAAKRGWMFMPSCFSTTSACFLTKRAHV